MNAYRKRKIDMIEAIIITSKAANGQQATRLHIVGHICLNIIKEFSSQYRTE